MIHVDQALRLFDEHVRPLPAIRTSIADALGRVAAADVTSRVELPPFAQSAMDGYAVRAADTPGELRVVGEVPAGKLGELAAVGQGEAVRIFTGARVPPGADAVVRQEWVERRDGIITVADGVEVGKDIRPLGEELAAGARLVAAGERLDEGHVAVLSMCGHADVEVTRPPMITLLVSGDEVVAPGGELRAGQVYDANTPFVQGWLARRGYDDVEVLALEDDRNAVERALSDALERSDLVVSTGGVSVGDYDFFTDVAAAVGLEQVFWKIRQKPGKPLFFARGQQTTFLGIPGNPGAVFTSVHVYLRRVLDLLEATASPGPRMRRGVLTEAVRMSSNRLAWTGCALDFGGDGVARLTPIRGHRLSQIYRADVIARIPEGDAELSAGALVDWFCVNR